MENSLAGAIHRNYDLLLQHDLYIIAEHNLRVSHCLIAHPGVALSEIRRVYSPPQALAQCEFTLRDLGIPQVIAATDTAGSVALVKEQGWRDAAAVASESAATVYGMNGCAQPHRGRKGQFHPLSGPRPRGHRAPR